MRQPYMANTLIKVALPAMTVTAPAEDRRGVVLFPMPSIEHTGDRRLPSPRVAFDLNEWFVHDVLASTLPVRCPSQTAARKLTDMWIGNIASGMVDPRNAAAVTSWCKWFADEFPDCAVYTPMPPPPAGDALTTAVVKALATVTTPETTTVSAAADTTRPDEGQANNEVQEEPV